MIEMTHDEWQQEGERRFGPDRMKWRFVCPSCREAIAVSEWKEAGAPEGAIAFSCIGRYKGPTEAAASAAFRNTGGPCNYTNGGLFNIAKVFVRFEDTKRLGVFEFADPETEECSD